MCWGVSGQWLVLVKDDLDMVCEASKAITLETEMGKQWQKTDRTA